MPRKVKSLFTCFGPSSSTSPPPSTPPPNEFLCPISHSLMADAVITPTGLTFEQACIEACKELNFVPPILPTTSLSDFLSSNLIPNSILKTLILNWCDSTGNPHPLRISQEEARGLVQNLKAAMNGSEDNQEPSSSDQGRANDADHSRIGERPKTAPSSLPSTSSDDNKDQSGAEMPNLEKQLSKKLSKIKADDAMMAAVLQFAFPSDPPKDSSIQRPTSADDASIEMQILNLLQDSNVSSKRLALNTLISQTMENSEKKISFCNERIMAALIPVLQSPNEDIQIDVTAAILGFTQEIFNRRNIVRWKAVPGLVHVLKTGMLEARANAAGAICNLAIDGLQNSMVIGFSGAITPLLEIFYNPSMGTMGRENAGLAIYHLTLWDDNLDILEEIGAAQRLHPVATDKSCDRFLRSCAIKIMYNLAGGRKGREELMDMDVVRAMLAMIREGEGMDTECLALMYKICLYCPVKFKDIAMETGAKCVLSEKKEEWGEQEKNMAKEMLVKVTNSEVSNEESVTEVGQSSQI